MPNDISVAHLAERSAVSASITNQELASELGIEQTSDNEALFESARQDFDAAAHNLVRAGVRFRILNERLPKDQFEAFLDAHNFDRRRAGEAIRAADFVAMLPKAERTQLLTAAPSKVVLLSKFSPSEISEFAESGQLTILVKMTWRELREWQQERSRERITKRLLDSGDLKKLPKSTYRAEPLALTVARDELIGTLPRARVEIEQAQDVFELLTSDLPDPARGDVLHFVASEAKQIAALATQLRVACQRSTARNVAVDLPELETIASKYLDDASRFALNAANASLTERAAARQRTLGKNGRPPSTMDALIKQVQKQSQGDEG